MSIALTLLSILMTSNGVVHLLGDVHGRLSVPDLEGGAVSRMPMQAIQFLPARSGKANREEAK
jgi:hypothetical protein